MGLGIGWNAASNLVMKKKIVLTSFLLALVTMTVVYLAALCAIYFRRNEELCTELKNQVDVYVALVDLQGDEALVDISSEILKGNKRLTIIGVDGSVIKDTGSNEVENHNDREEIKSARLGDPQIVKRFSKTLGKNMYYYAKMAQDGTVVRLAFPASEVSNYFLATLPAFILSALAACVVSIIFASNLSSSVGVRVDKIRESLASLNKGAYVPIETSSAEPEFYAVLTEVNSLSASINEHIKYEQQVSAKLKGILGGINQGVIALGEQNEISEINEVALSLFSCSGNAVGQALPYLIDDMALCNRILSETDGFLTDYKGRIFSVCFAKAGSFGIKKLIIVSDETDRQNILKQKTEFFANASHELKTPLTTMQGLSELLLSAEGVDEKTRRYAERINAEAARMNDCIMDMLRLSNYERGVLEGDNESVNLREIAHSTVLEYGAIADKKGLKTEIFGEESVIADPRKIYDLVANLYTNAVNYNREGGKIKIEITRTGGGVELKVSDTGIGIASEHIPRLCERFYRVDKSRSKKTGGTGLGLAIVKHICAIYGATLNIESILGVGTSVSVVFPNNKNNEQKILNDK